MTFHVLVLLLGILALLVGSDVAIGGASRLARRLRLSDLVIGLTVVAVGTSLPELATTVTGALASGTAADETAEAAAGVAIGNVVGSNVFLLTALLGLTGLVRALPVSIGSLKRDGLALVGFTAALLFGFASGTLSRALGVLLLLAYAAYLAYVVRDELRGQVARDRSRVGDGKPGEERPDAETSDWAEDLLGYLPAPQWARDALVVFAGLGTVVMGASLVVNHGVAIAEHLDLPGALVGVFVGAATSLPEVVVSASAASKGTTDIAVGNIMGSSITNIGLCLGVAAITQPIPISPLLLKLDYPFLAVSTLIALLLMWEKEELSRPEGGALLLLFALYLTLRVGIG